MPVTVIVGGQFGSEGKGKVALYMAKEMQATFVVRCGGSNSGHTVVDDQGNRHIFRHLPTAAILQDIKLVIPSGSYIDEEVLIKEIQETGVTEERLFISPYANIITNQSKVSEKECGIISSIGSTGSGTGASVISRIHRDVGNVVLARDRPNLKKYIRDVTLIMRDALQRNERIIVEGTQGFGLSLLHSPYYPFVTSRDTTASAFIAEAGLSPCDVDNVVLVIRAFPIRVSGNSGKLPHEITWEQIQKEGDHEKVIKEYTSVTKKLRRVARFDPEIVKMAINVNSPNIIILNHVDYIQKDIQRNQALLKNVIKNIETKIGRKIDYIGLSDSHLQKIHDSVNIDIIPPGMLSSPQIQEYINAGLLIRIPDGTMDRNCFKSATYDMRLGNYAVRFDNGEKREIKLRDEEDKNTLILLPNSLTFVTTHEEFNLPKDVIARFNLKGKFVHQGLLLGTGPIVDPEFQGKLLIPIHNFSNEKVRIKYLESLISVEFTKTLNVDNNKLYIKNKHSKGVPEDYLSRVKNVESSVYRKIENLEISSEKQKNESKRLNTVTILSVFGATIAFFGIIISTHQLIDAVNVRLDDFSAKIATNHKLNIENYRLLSDDLANVKRNIDTKMEYFQNQFLNIQKEIMTNKEALADENQKKD